MNTIKFKCVLGTSDASCPLGLEIWLDDQQIYCNEWVKETTTVECDLPEADGEHKLRWILAGKTDQHTRIDDAGNIIEDTVLTISNITFDDIDVNQLVTEQAIYTHNFNGHSDTVEEKFFGSMGCNGTVSLEFSTPMYLWLLEHM